MEVVNDMMTGSCCSGEDVRREVKRMKVSESQGLGKHSVEVTEVAMQLSVVRVAFSFFFSLALVCCRMERCMEIEV